MKGAKQEIKIGTEVLWDGDRHVITGFRSGSVELRSTHGGSSLIHARALTTAPGFKILWPKGKDEQDVSDTPNFEDNLPEEARIKALVLLSHILEATTGYRSGNALDRRDDEPRPQYDPELTTMTRRLETKALELKKTRRWAFNLLSRYRSNGISGLTDGRLARLGVERIDPRIRQVVGQVLDECTDASTISRKKISRLVERRLKEKYPDQNVRLPSQSTFFRLITDVSKSRRTFGSSKGRRSAANSPETTYSHFVTHRPGEMVLIDSTPLDAYALDPLTFQWIQIQLTIAYDLFTRSILAWRFTPVSTKAVDAAMLLYDLLRPKTVGSGWSDTTHWAYVGVPESIIVEVYADLPPQSKIAAIPFLHPESVIVDRGKVFLSNAFAQACTTLGINLYIARPYTATDKAHVERVFRSIRENFVENLPGYKGPDVYSRGLNVEGEAFYFLDEINGRFEEWVATYWQQRQHDGLELPHVPKLHLSPNDMFEVGLATAGFIYVVPSTSIYYQLIPTEWRMIHNYGIDINSLRYDGDALNNYRNLKSPYRGANPGKWPIKYDPRDLSRVFFYDHETSTWHALNWIGATGEHRPFTDKLLSYAKAKVLTGGGNRSNAPAVENALKDLLNRMDEEVMLGGKERRLAALNAIQSARAKNDQPKERPANSFQEELSRNEVPIVNELPDFGEGEFDLEQPRKGVRILRSGDDFLEDEEDDLSI